MIYFLLKKKSACPLTQRSTAAGHPTRPAKHLHRTLQATRAECGGRGPGPDWLCPCSMGTHANKDQHLPLSCRPRGCQSGRSTPDALPDCSSDQSSWPTGHTCGVGHVKAHLAVCVLAPSAQNGKRTGSRCAGGGPLPTAQPRMQREAEALPRTTPDLYGVIVTRTDRPWN